MGVRAKVLPFSGRIIQEGLINVKYMRENKVACLLVEHPLALRSVWNNLSCISESGRKSLLFTGQGEALDLAGIEVERVLPCYQLQLKKRETLLNMRKFHSQNTEMINRAQQCLKLLQVITLKVQLVVRLSYINKILTSLTFCYICLCTTTYNCATWALGTDGHSWSW